MKKIIYILVAILALNSCDVLDMKPLDEPSGPVVAGIGESSLFMTEHFTFEQRLRNASQIDFDKRFALPAAVFVDCFGNQFLTCAAFAGDQHRGIRLADA